MSVLIIEDNRDLASARRSAQRKRFSVESAHTGKKGLKRLLEDSTVSFWISSSGINGFQVVEEYRKEDGSSPVLILSARDSVDDKVEGFNRGADDYMVKPFDSRELIVRVRSLIRRAADKQSPLLACGRLTLDPVTRECRVDGAFVNLRRREFDILETMLRHANQVFTGNVLSHPCGKRIRRQKQRCRRPCQVSQGQAGTTDLICHRNDTRCGYKIRCSEVGETYSRRRAKRPAEALRSSSLTLFIALSVWRRRRISIPHNQQHNGIALDIRLVEIERPEDGRRSLPEARRSRGYPLSAPWSRPRRR